MSTGQADRASVLTSACLRASGASPLHSAMRVQFSLLCVPAKTHADSFLKELRPLHRPVRANWFERDSSLEDLMLALQLPSESKGQSTSLERCHWKSRESRQPV